MAKIDVSSRRRRGGGLWVLALVVLILIGVGWLTAPSRSTPNYTGALSVAAGVIESGPKPSSGLSHPGAMTQGLPGTDSRDNGAPSAGRAAPSVDPVPAPTPPGPPSADSNPA